MSWPMLLAGRSPHRRIATAPDDIHAEEERVRHDLTT